jgi:hypothetical protein
MDWADSLWVSHLLNSDIPADQQMDFHRKDLWSTWFGVPYYQDIPQLYVYERLQVLVQKHGCPREDESQYPSLVSFFGDTGSGKSTLIRVLIQNSGPGMEEFEVPVSGNAKDMHKSTSSDVHLYADPLSISTSVPLFYAGGQSLPRA